MNLRGTSSRHSSRSRYPVTKESGFRNLNRAVIHSRLDDISVIILNDNISTTLDDVGTSSLWRGLLRQVGKILFIWNVSIFVVSNLRNYLMSGDSTQATVGFTSKVTPSSTTNVGGFLGSISILSPGLSMRGVSGPLGERTVYHVFEPLRLYKGKKSATYGLPRESSHSHVVWVALQCVLIPPEVYDGWVRCFNVFKRYLTHTGRSS
jgi:hypothetical protein